jgi:hypothetical protein
MTELTTANSRVLQTIPLTTRETLPPSIQQRSTIIHCGVSATVVSAFSVL